MTSDEWLKRLAPGTLLYLKSWPEGGFHLVYHVESESFPGPWVQLQIWLVDPRCKLTKVDVESGVFQDRWAIVDVER